MRTPSLSLPRFFLTVAAALPLWAVGTARAADTYDVSKTDGKAAIGQKASATVTIQGKNGWHVNEDAPFTVKLLPSAGVNVDKPKLTRSDLAEANKDRARFDVGFTGSAAGPHTIGAEANFVMCQASACQPVKERITLAVDISAAAPTPEGKSEGKKPSKKKLP